MALFRGNLRNFFSLLLLCCTVLVFCLIWALAGTDTTETASQQVVLRTLDAEPEAASEQVVLWTVDAEPEAAPWFERYVEQDNILDNPEKPLMTLFTTFDVSDTFRQQIYNNSITLCPQLGSGVRLILFFCDGLVEEDPLVQLAIKYGWTLQITPCEPNLNLPLFRHMFLEAQKIHKTTFYVFANADMLFDMSLVGSLAALRNGIRENIVAKRTHMLGFGARTMIDVGETRQIKSLEEVRSIAQKEGRFFTVAGVDYFIATQGVYPWNSIPDFVVSRVLFDSWTVNFFVRNKFMTFDLTDTILAAHQCDGRLPFRSETLVDGFHNKDLMKRNFVWREGIITCSKYKSNVTVDGKKFQLWERVKKGFCGAMTGTPAEMQNHTRYQLMMQQEKAVLFKNISLSYKLGQPNIVTHHDLSTPNKGT